MYSMDFYQSVYGCQMLMDYQLLIYSFPTNYPWRSTKNAFGIRISPQKMNHTTNEATNVFFINQLHGSILDAYWQHTEPLYGKGRESGSTEQDPGHRALTPTGSRKETPWLCVYIAAVKLGVLDEGAMGLQKVGYSLWVWVRCIYGIDWEWKWE